MDSIDFNDVEQISQYRKTAGELEGEKTDKAFLCDTKRKDGALVSPELIFEKVAFLPSSFGDTDYVVVQAKTPDGKRITFAGGVVITSVMKQVKDKLPLKGIIVKPKGKRYYNVE